MATKKAAVIKSESEKTSREVPVAWVGFDDAEVRSVSHFLAQYEREGETHLLTFGMISPPPLLGSVRERIEMAERLTHIPINHVAKISLSSRRLDDLIDVLQRHRRNVKKSMKDAEGGGE
jgi:hypothetical protein